MSLSTRDRLRQMADDQPVLFQDKATGDGSGSVYFLSHYPCYPNSGTAGTVAVNGTVYGTASYTLNWQYGRVTFSTTPLNAGTVQADYLAASFTDDEVDDAWAEAGGSVNLYAAAASLWRIKAGRHAPHYSFRDAGQQFDRSDWHKACLAMAQEYQTMSKVRAARAGAWVSGVSIDAKDTQEEDSDRVQSRFKRDQFSNPGSVDDIDDLSADD